MTNIKKLTNFGILPVLGLGVAWLGISIIKSERRLEIRRMELEIQLHAKSIKNI
tara:strand:- start:443 stop:604 length:162 start_codon:yes stop_codon:yes gene_type:complete